jgi:Holliday junction resolvase RusA-like endonuclease
MIIIDIAPMGAKRMTARGKFVKTDAQRYLNYKRLLGYQIRQHIKEPTVEPVEVEIKLYYPIPESWPKYKKKEAREGKRRPVVKPDLDNCVKGVFDSCNMIAWKDDAQVVKETSEKWYSDHPRIELVIREWGA